MAGTSHRGIEDPGPPVWPVFALLLPVLILAALAGVAMARDWRAARGEASARGKELALEAVARILPLLSDRPAGFEVGVSNQLVHPAPREWPPVPQPLPPFPNSTSREAWDLARLAWNEGRWDDTVRHFDEFLAPASSENGDPSDNPSTPDPRLRRLAWYERALALERIGGTDAPGLIDAFDRVLGAFPWTGGETLSESGVAIGTLAALRIVELAAGDAGQLPASWRTHARQLPEALAAWPPSPFLSTVTKTLEDLAGSPAGRELWETPQLVIEPLKRAEFHRERHAEAMGRFGPATPWPAGFWLTNLSPDWLAWDSTSTKPAGPPEGLPPRRTFSLVQESLILSALQAARENLDRRGDFSLRLHLAGRGLPLGGALDTPWRPSDELASIRRAVTADLDFELGVRLADPMAFYAGQRRRLAWFGGFLGLAAVAALVSTWATRRALGRQRQLNREKSNFVSSVSHELRAPLACIRLLAEGLERGSVPTEERRREYFRLIGQETRRLGSLVENVLDYARIEQGRKRYEKEPTDLAALVRDTVRLAERTAADRPVRIALTGIPSSSDPAERATDPWEFTLDGRSIQQALLNLIDNALKHAPDGSTIEVALARAKRQGTQDTHDADGRSVPPLGPRPRTGDSQGGPGPNLRPVLPAWIRTATRDGGRGHWTESRPSHRPGPRRTCRSPERAGSRRALHPGPARARTTPHPQPLSRRTGEGGDAARRRVRVFGFPVQGLTSCPEFGIPPSP